METKISSFLKITQRKENLLLLVILIAGLSIFGWLINEIILTSVSSKFIPIAPSSALLFFILGSFFIINYNFKKSRFTKSFAIPLLFIVALFSLFIFLDYFLHFRWEIETIFIANPEKFGEVLKGRMSPISAILFFFTCISILTSIGNRSNTFRYIGGTLSLFTGFISTVLLIGYLYNAPLLYGSRIIPVPLLTAICFLLFSVTLLRVSELKFWTFNLIKNNPTELILLKTFLPLVIIIVFLQGFIDTIFSEYENITPLTSALILFIIILSTVFIITRASAILSDKLLRAEKKLKESEEFNRNLLQTIPFGMDIVDESGTILFQSENLKKYFGEKVIGNTCWKMYRDDQTQCFDCPLYHGIKVGVTEVYESSGVLGGQIFEIIHTGMMFEGKKAMLEIFINITERKQAEKSIRDSEAQFRALFENAGDGIIYLSLNTQIVKSNRSFAEMHGYTIDEMNNVTLQYLDVEDLSKLAPDRIKRILNGENLRFEAKHFHKDGHILDLDVSASLVHLEKEDLIVTFHRDVTERKRAEEAIRDSEAHLKTLIQTIPDLIWLKDKKSRYLSCNSSFEQLIGIKESDLVGKTDYDLTDRNNSDIFHQFDRNVIATEKTTHFEHWVTFKENGKRALLDIIKTPMYNSLGEITGVLGVAHDITNRKQAETEIKNKNEELLEINAQKDKFFSIIAHDLKSPFNSIVGFSELLVEQMKKNDLSGTEKYAEIIQQSSQRAMDLLMNLMEWSRSQTGRMEFNPEYFEMVELINDTELLLSGAAEQKSIILKKELPSHLTVYADKNMIRTVFRNLISNAIKFTRSGGIINVSAKEDQNNLMISVQDTGIGIPLQAIEKLFHIDSKYSTSGTQNEQGTGLGLILCREFVEKHGGEIWVESTEGKGSTFYFNIPLNLNLKKETNFHS